MLSYARLERGRADGRVENVSLEPTSRADQGPAGRPRRQAGMELVVEVDEAAPTVVRANPSAVEQILFNLVDNACKYAAARPTSGIHLVGCPDRPAGPSIWRSRPRAGHLAAVARRLFRSFSKSAHEAAHSAPGVGLGLALSRRLARDMGAGSGSTRS